jgi:hypothetical protein
VSDCGVSCVPDATRLDCVVTDADPGIPSQSAQTDCAGLCISHDPINRLVILCSFAIHLQSNLIVLIEAIIGSIVRRSGMGCEIRGPFLDRLKYCKWIALNLPPNRDPQDCKRLCRHCQGLGWIANGREFLDNFVWFAWDLWISQDFFAIQSIPCQSIAVLQSRRNSIGLFRIANGLP